MAGGSKRLDLQFGSFACSVQGFDDPVKPVQQVLHAMQHVLEESPELATAGINFDAEMIEQLIEEVGRRADLEESSVEIVPGLIIIHHGELRGRSSDAGKAAVIGAEEDEGAIEPPDYVNIFAPARHAQDPAPSGTDDAEEAEDLPLELVAEEPEDAPLELVAEGAEDAQSDLIAARLGGLGQDGTDGNADRDGKDDADLAEVPRDIFAESDDEPAARHSIFAEASGPSARASGPSDVSFFSTPLKSIRRSSDGASDARPQEDARPHEVDEAVSLRLFSAASAGASEPEPTGPSLVAGPSEPAAESEPAGESYTAGSLAEKAGATAVADLIVSAAAWMVLIKGQTSFSRKDVLEVFDGMPGEHDKSIQSRIKGFGKAVRNDQLVQIEEGLFGLSRSELKRFEKAL